MFKFFKTMKMGVQEESVEISKVQTSKKDEPVVKKVFANKTSTPRSYAGLTDPVIEKENIFFRLRPGANRKADEKTMDARLMRLLEDGWRAVQRFKTAGGVRVMFEKTVHPISCRCEFCESLPPIVSKTPSKKKLSPGMVTK